MYSPFEYVSVNNDFIIRLFDSLATGDSIVLMGLKYSGKKIILAEIRKRLNDNGHPAVYLELSDKLIAQKEVLQDELKDAFKNASLESEEDIENKYDRDILSLFDQYYEQKKQPAILLCAGLDNILLPLARILLTEIRARVQSKQLIVALSGHQDFSRLVYGPNSEFNCANMFVIQKYDLDQFKIIFDNYTTTLSIKFADPDDACSNLWRKTNGNIYLLRILLFTIIVNRTSGKEEDSEYDICKIPERLYDLRNPFVLGIDYFKNTTYLIEREPDCWRVLELLIKEKKYNLIASTNFPNILEFANIAIRENGELKFSSEFFDAYISVHYNDLRLGNLYAKRGMWDEAFNHYIRATKENRISLVNSHDATELRVIINAIGTRLHSIGDEGIERLKEMIKKTLIYVLGYQDVVFEEYDKPWNTKKYATSENFERIVEIEYKNYLNYNGFYEKAISNDIKIEAEPNLRIRILPGTQPNHPVFLIVSDSDLRTANSEIREELTTLLLDQFSKAYSRVVDVEQAKSRLNIIEQHRKIFQHIVYALGKELLDVLDVIKKAARGLSELGYR
jgi:hypothetical protein